MHASTAVFKYGHGPKDPSVAEQFPDALGDLKLSGARRFDDPAHGVAASYVAQDRKATVFIYTEGIAGIPDDIDDPVVRDAFGRACGELEEMGRLGYYLNVALIERGVATVALPWRDARLHHARYSLELPAKDGKPSARMLAHIYLASVQGTFLKARYSYAAGGDNDPPVPDLGSDLALAFMGSELVMSGDDEQEFRRTEPYVRRVGQWLEDNPRYPPDSMSRQAMMFVMKWFIDAPYFSVMIDSGHLIPLTRAESCGCGDFLTTMFTIGCGLRVLDAPESTAPENKLTGTEYMLRAYRNLVAGGGGQVGCEGLKPLLEAEAAGELAGALGE